MSSSLIAATFASSSSFGYSAAFRASTLTSGGSGAETTTAPSEVRKANHKHDDHDHGWHRGQHTGSTDASQASGEAYTSLKIKIEQTFSSLLNHGDDSAGTDDSSTDTAASFEGVFKARIQLSGPDGTVEAKLKLKFQGDGAQTGDDFKNALQGFTDALFSALRSLYGTPPSAIADNAPAPAVSTTAPTAVTATPSGLGAADPGATNPVALPTASAPTPSTASSDVATATDTSTPPTPAPAPAQTNTSTAFNRSVTIKLRLTYDSFNNNVGGLVNQLAQPNITDAFPGLGSALDDLASQFDKLLSLAPAASGTPPTLGQFLSALSQAFGGNGAAGAQAAATASPTPTLPAPETSQTDAAAIAAGSVPAATNSIADEAAETPAVMAAETPPPPSTATLQHYTAMAEYKQVLSYSDAGSSFSLQTRLRASAVYELA